MFAASQSNYHPNTPNTFTFSFVRYPQEEMAKNAVDTLAHNPVENFGLQVLLGCTSIQSYC